MQFTTVAMHAWSQVEHDIIYKQDKGLVHTSTMARMLDAINGQAITIKILLDDELCQDLDHESRELEQKRRRPLNHYQKLADWYQEQFLTKDEKVPFGIDYDDRDLFGKIALHAYNVSHFKATGYGDPQHDFNLSRQRILDLFEKHGWKNPTMTTKYGESTLAVEILHALFRETREGHSSALYNSDPSNHLCSMGWLYKMLLFVFANAFSLMAARGEDYAVQLLEQKFWQGGAAENYSNQRHFRRAARPA